MKRILAWFLALIMVFGMVSLPKMTKAEGEEDPDQPESVEEIVNDVEDEPKAPGTKDGQYFDIDCFTMAVGETKQLETTLTDAVWGSDNEDIVTVDRDFVVTAHSVGHAYIWAYGIDEGLGFDVTHQWEIYVTQLTLSADALELPLGGSGVLTASYKSVFEYYTIVSTDVTADCTWSWTGNDPAIASFDETNGVVTAGAEQYGTATLTAAYTPEGWDHPLQASCTVTVPAEKPTITVQPKDVTVKSGSKARFTVKAKETHVSYQWYTRATEADEWTAMDGETKAELSVIGTKGNMNSQYRCLVSTAEGGEAYTDIATLTVILQRPKIKTQPRDAKVKSGAKAKFTVKASGKDLSYQWFKRIGPADDWFEMEGETKATLTFTATMLDDSSQYYCRVANPDGEIDSDFASLEVIPQVPEIKTHPKSATVKSGAKVKLSVKATGPNLLYRWFSRPDAGSEFIEIAGETKAELNLVASMALNGWQYCCEVRNTDGAEASNVATLTVTPVPASIKTQPKDATVKSGSKAKFSVKASGPNLQYQWYERASENAPWAEVEGAVKAEYSFKATMAKNGYQYRCKVWNDDETLESNAATLTVTPVPPKFGTQPKDAKVKLGEEAEFKVKASGGVVTYQWYYRTSEDGEWKVMNGETGNNLIVVAEEGNIGWQFLCRATNEEGSTDSKIATLKLR